MDRETKETMNRCTNCDSDPEARKLAVNSFWGRGRIVFPMREAGDPSVVRRYATHIVLRLYPCGYDPRDIGENLKVKPVAPLRYEISPVPKGSGS